MGTRTTYRMAAAAALVGAALVAGAAFAVPAGPMAGRRAVGAFRAALRKVGLSADQRNKIRTIVRGERPTIEGLRGRRESSRAELNVALQAPNPDPTAVGSALLRTRADRQALRAELRKMRDETLSVLTPDQRARLDGYLAGARAARRGAQ
ncbi:MAG TPA: periplasmic heavy metal sensor [Thermoanaerobaculaceae bacterium]|nr:periplasmic heavy metal sensor [Thermoanaerobaculaceae bacterium]